MLRSIRLHDLSVKSLPHRERTCVWQDFFYAMEHKCSIARLFDIYIDSSPFSAQVRTEQEGRTPRSEAKLLPRKGYNK